ncbi:MaoC family dehydratase N-terminal domain-containing protein [Cryptosporangium sp. NPDC051539]|uniref:MaoC family dehydratase N-terminal domain-containing protein n=1 Tax=Cryptosporangium sp. NPDC051539 TaxID=3363962 RepID=UPI0037B89D42
MTLREALLATELTPFSVVVERGQLQFFAEAIGERAAVYVDIDGARAANYPDLLVPPTFFFSLELQRPDPHAALRVAGAQQSQLLHAGQSFEYHRLAFAGDELQFTPRITDYYEKKGGALAFLTRTTSVSRQGEPVAELVNQVAIRRPAG